jgi:aspartate/methionine/tyrosine aminotransferase
LFFLWFEGGFFMADDNRTLFEKAVGNALSLAAAPRKKEPIVDQQETFVDLGQPILPAIGLIEKAANLVASAAAFVAYASERQLLDRKVLSDAMRTLRNIPKSDTMFWAGRGAEAQKNWDARQKEAGTDKKFIKASLGQPNFPTLEGLVDNGIAFLKSHFKNFNYTATEGDPTVIKAVEAFMQTRFFFNDQDCMREKKVCLTNGAKEGLSRLYQAAVGRPGRTVYIFDPGWVSYHEEIKDAGGKPERISTTQSDGSHRSEKEILDDLESSIDTGLYKDSIIIFPNPNPGGRRFSDDFYNRLADIMRKNLDVLGIGDNIYNRVVRDGEKPVPLFSDFAPDLADRVAEVFGAAKDGGLASERVSWICGPLEWIERAVNKKSSGSGNVPASTQAMLHAFVTTDAEQERAYIESCNRAYFERIDIVQDCFRSLGFKVNPVDVGFYAFPSLKGSPFKGATFTLSDGTTMQINNGKDFVKWCFDLGIGLTPGEVFDHPPEGEPLDEDEARISCATSTPEIEEMCRRITEYGREGIMNDGTGRTVGQYLDDCLEEESAQKLAVAGDRAMA